MRKTMCYLLVMLFIALNMNINASAKEYQTAIEAVKDANNFLNNILQLQEYYKERKKIPIKNSDGKTEKIELGLYEKYAKQGPVVFKDKPVFVYGNDPETVSKDTTTKGNYYYFAKDVGELAALLKAGKYQSDEKIYRALGYATDGSVFANPDFPHDNEGYKSKDKRWVEFPWKPKNIKTLYCENGRMPDTKDISDVRYYIEKWITENQFSPQDLNRYLNEDIYKDDSEKRGKYFADNALNPPPIDKFENCLYIIQPPTEHVWGLGIAFYYWDGNSNNSTFDYHLNYRSFLLKPFDMMYDDLSAQFKFVSPYLPTKKAAPGEEVKVGIIVGSKLNKAYTGVRYRLDITKDDGTQVPYRIEASKDMAMTDGTMDIPESGARLYVNLIMPESHVNIDFAINEDGGDPKEDNLSNNRITNEFLPKLVRAFDLDYNVLTRNVGFPLEDFDITAHLTLPEGAWNGNAEGSLEVSNDTTDLSRDFVVKNNPAVNEASETIVRNPEISTSFHRKDFGDNPRDNKWLDWQTPLQPKTRYGDISYKGSVARPYQYNYYCSDEDCGGHIGNDTAKADFFSSTCTYKAGVYIYNGKKSITPKIYKNQIDSNNDGSLTKNMFWISEPYKFNVIRLMYDMDVNKRLSAPVRVNGQYKRTFTNQNSAVSNWKTTGSMKDSYKKSSLEKGALATDKAYRGIDFPIRSGYYFNPAGAYTFKITTVAYKPGKGSTKDHADLVQTFINAFRYESNLVYKDRSNHPVDLANRPVRLSSKGYAGQPAVLSVNSVGLDGRRWMSVEYDKTSTTCYIKEQPEVIEFPKLIDERTEDKMSVTTDKNANAKTDTRWRNILEGYAESGTLESFNSFKYREYVNDRQEKNTEGMYKITETSTVTIRVNPNNIKAYTHDRMADGDYYARAWIADIPFEGHTDNAYKVLPVLQGISSLDKINIRVVGSKSDDIKFN